MAPPVNKPSDLWEGVRSPSVYASTNAGHQKLNNELMLKLKSLLPISLTGSSVLDIGCGTGDSTFAMAQGKLGDLGVPSSVLGVDQSADMVKLCRRLENRSNLSFAQKNLDQLAEMDDKFDLITAFSSLHWEPDQPRVLATIHRLLKPGGCFVFVSAGAFDPERNTHRKIWNQLKQDKIWEESLEHESWPELGVQFDNATAWNSTIDHNGYGFLCEKDYVPLLLSKGFEVLHCETTFPSWWYTETFAEGYVRSVLFPNFLTLQGAKRKAFLKEYEARIRESNGGGLHFSKPLPSGLGHCQCDAVSGVVRR